MSQSISIFHFDKPSIDKYWQELKDDRFGITTLQWVPELRKNLDYVLDELKNNPDMAFYSFAEMDDEIVRHYSKRSYDDYKIDVEEPLKFWLWANTGKSFIDDFEENIEFLDKETWKLIFSQPKNIHEVKELLTQVNSSEYYTDISEYRPVDMIDWFLRVKEVYEYSELTETKMIALHEDRSLSQFWTNRQKILWQRMKPTLEELASRNSS